jgi:hypothetical protein
VFGFGGVFAGSGGGAALFAGHGDGFFGGAVGVVGIIIVVIIVFF